MQQLNAISSEEKEVRLLISSLKNVLTDVPYDFMYEADTYDCNDDDDDDEYYD